MKADYKAIQRKIVREPACIKSDLIECAMRTEIVDGEVIYYLKFKDKREFRAIYSSRLVGETLLGEPVIITKEEYERY